MSHIASAPHPHSRRPSLRAAGAAAAVVLGAASLTACSSDSGDDAAPGDGRTHTPTIVASTNVYGAIAEAVAGGKATVTSIIKDPSGDPHSYEATPADAAAVTGADLVVYNGAGYDAFVDDALANASGTHAVKAVDVFTATTGVAVRTHEHGDDDHKPADGAQGHDDHAHDDHAHDEHGHGDPTTTDNEHVWFSLPTVAALATQIADQLAALDTADAETFRANASSFSDSITPLTEKLKKSGSEHHAHYVQTEPIGGHLFEDAGFHDVTPEGFTSAIEQETDPSAADFAATRDLLSTKKATFLAFNTQTQTPTTDALEQAARSASVPVVELTETLPEGVTYVQWMGSVVDSVVTANHG